MTLERQDDLNGQLSFGEFTFFPDRLELRRDGVPLRLQQQPLRVLAALVRQPGDLVTREHIRREVWGDGVHLDFHDSLNHSMKYLRDALGDDPAKPRYIETVPRRGYRFIAQVTTIAAPKASVSAAEPELAAVAGHAKGKRAWLTGGLVLLIATAAFLSIASMPRRAPRVVSVEQVTHLGLVGAVLTDGDSIYVQRDQGGGYQILRGPATGNGELTPIRTPFGNAMLLDISRDKKELLIAAFEHWGDPALLFRLPLATGTPERLGSIVSYSAKWSADGTHLAFRGWPGDVAGLEAVYVASATGESPRKVFDQAADVNSWSPDGRTIYVSTMDAVNGGQMMWQVATDGSGARPMASTSEGRSAVWGEGICCGTWTRDGNNLLFFKSHYPTTGVWAMPRRGIGPVQEHATEVYAAGFRMSSPPAVAPDRDRIYVVGWNENREVMRFDPARGEFAAFPLGSQAGTARWSPDGQWIVYSRSPDMSLWKLRADGSGPRQLVGAPFQAFGAAWSPDGRRLAVHVLQRGKPGKIAIVPADGGVPKILLANERSVEDSAWWSPDGRSLYIGRIMLDAAGGGEQAVWKIDVSTEHSEKLAGTQDMDSPVLSPDGRWIAAQSEDSRRLILYDVSAHTTRDLATGVYISAPQWTRDSSALVYQDVRVSEEQPIFRVNVRTGRSIRIASSRSFSGPAVSQFRLVALDPHDLPVAVAIRRNADVYALNLEVP